MAADQTGVLLAAARDVLAGVVVLPSVRRARAAALLARSALEDLVDDAVDRLDPGAREASVRVKLICLSTLNPDVGHSTSWTWHALSEACHEHAYQLTPTVTEVAYLIEQVERLITESGALAAP